MTPDFAQRMTEAMRLTRGGNLQAATAAIQAALAGANATVPTTRPTTPPPGGDVIDVQANVVDVHAHGVDLPGRSALPAGPAPRPAMPATPAHAFAPDGPGSFVAGHHTGAAGARDYKLYLPPVLDALAPGQTVPLVVMLHGCTQTPDDFAAGTGMNAAARAQGVVVLYPAQSNAANPGRCWNWFKHNHQQRGKGEPALLADMTRAVMATYPIDPQRVYVAGLSAGGAMAAILGDAYPDLFAAVGVHSGLATGAARDAQSAFAAMQGGAPGDAAGSTGAKAGPPTIVFHGDQDTTVHPVNGEQVVAQHASARPPHAAGAPAPQPARATSANGRDYTRHTHRNLCGHVAAEHWVVHGAGHAWSGGSAAGSYTDARGPDATREMLRFFLEHPRPRGA